MDIKEIKGLSENELKEKLSATRKQLMELEFKKSTGVEKPHLFRQAKKDIARILPVLKENSKKIEPPQKEQKEKI